MLGQAVGLKIREFLSEMCDAGSVGLSVSLPEPAEYLWDGKVDVRPDQVLEPWRVLDVSEQVGLGRRHSGNGHGENLLSGFARADVGQHVWSGWFSSVVCLPEHGGCDHPHSHPFRLCQLGRLDDAADDRGYRVAAGGGSHGVGVVLGPLDVVHA